MSTHSRTERAYVLLYISYWSLSTLELEPRRECCLDYSCSPLSTEDIHFQDLQWMPETADSTELYIYIYTR